MYHFFVKEHQLSNDIITVFDEDAHHIKDVLRLKKGEEISFSVEGDEGTEYRCSILEYTEDSVTCELLFKKESNIELPCRITLYQGLPKGDKMETVIQKAVELGAYRIVPVSMSRSIVKLDDKKAAKKISRWQAISESAAKQSQRGLIPEVTGVKSYREAILEAAQSGRIILPYERAEGMEATRAVIKSITNGEQLSVFIGPEGGFAEEEIDLARDNGAHIISLGKRILRTETAGMTLLSFLVYALEK